MTILKVFKPEERILLFDHRIPGCHPRLLPQSCGYLLGSPRGAAQFAVLKRKRPRPSLNRLDRLFWITLRYIWPRWSDVLLIVKRETVVGWHRAGFRLAPHMATCEAWLSVRIRAKNSATYGDSVNQEGV